MNKNPNINLNQINKKGETPLHIAIEKNNMAMVKLLLHLGAGLKPINFEGQSPFTMLEERQLDFLVKNKDSEAKSESVSSSKSKMRNTPVGTVQIQIEDIKDEVADDMFSNMRTYFQNNNGYLSPKNECEEIDIRNATISESLEQKESVATNEDCNVTDSDIVPEHVYETPAFHFRNMDKPFLSLTKDSTEGTTTKNSKYGSDVIQENSKTPTKNNRKVGPDSFKVIKLLGVGSFGEVFLVEKIDSGKLFAMKILKKDKIFKRNLTKYAVVERNVLCVSSHPFIVKLHYAFQTSDRLFLIMEYCPGGDLGDYLEAEDCFSEHKARFYISEVILAIEDLHNRGIIYRDLKPDNIVLDKHGHVKLADFGLSKEGMEKINNFTKSF